MTTAERASIFDIVGFQSYGRICAQDLMCGGLAMEVRSSDSHETAGASAAAISEDRALISKRNIKFQSEQQMDVA